ncbi:hypothetical protein DL93DRAFT_2086915 [Clavulina sp. PMI_390]|nr:hypothetical protein DL93DRAFT_2086915 [Clavulina sp. PMI_390]
MIALEKLRVPLPVVLLGAENDYGDDEGNQENDAWKFGYSNDCHSVTSTHNPLDELLPPKLTSLTLDMGDLSIRRFIERTGIPHSPAFTWERMPSLVTLIVNGYHPGPEEVSRYFLQRAPELKPPIRLTLFGHSN